METTNVLFAGVGGQGIVLASKILAKCAFEAGLQVKESELHGMAQRGGSVVSHVRFGKEVNCPLITMGEADILISLEELEGLRCYKFLKPKATIIFNQKQLPPPSVSEQIPYPVDTDKTLSEMGFAVIKINAPEIARVAGSPKTENIALLGALSALVPQIDLNIWQNVITQSVPAKFLEQNLKAFEAGRQVTILRGN